MKINDELNELVREITAKPRRFRARVALINQLNPNLVKLLGKKYLLKNDYHWRVYYSGTLENKYKAHVDYVIKFFRGKSGKLLDVGCGEGLIMKCIQETSNLECFGIDNSLLAIEYARQHNVQNCEFIDLKNYDRTSFDYVFMGDLLEHLEKPETALENAANQWLVDNGLLFVSCPIQEKKRLGNHHLFSKDEALKLIRSFFIVDTVDIHPECQKMYFTARKPLFKRRRIT